jgi:nitrogen regulatory protein PII
MRDERAEAGLGGDLWMIVAIVQPFRLDPVTLALERIGGFGGMTVSDCRGFGRGKTRDEGDEGSGAARSREDEGHPASAGLSDFTKMVRLDIAVHGRALADAVVETIARTAHTGRRGDGKIFVWPLERAMRVRTLETDALAL